MFARGVPHLVFRCPGATVFANALAACFVLGAMVGFVIGLGYPRTALFAAVEGGYLACFAGVIPAAVAGSVVCLRRRRQIGRADRVATPSLVEPVA